ncbi:hypothetical protein [Salinimicrobium terrae]|uniref:hypothetical protein n=1 Tax=Salinimicrobium terrae TaxID=470866 RepID=UPI00040E7CCC|nr:hypothetical protein [Salinimicrobium terrae]
MRYLLLVFLLSVNVSFAQKAGPITTEEQNSRWLQELDDRQLEEKLEMIKERWMADTAVIAQPGIPHQKDSRNRINFNSRPIYIFTKNKEGRIIFPTNPSAEKIVEVSKMLIPENISEVNVETGKITVIYGARGSGGIIFIVVSEDFNFAKLKEILVR